MARAQIQQPQAASRSGLVGAECVFLLASGRNGGSGERGTASSAVSGSVATSSDRRLITIIAEIIAWICRSPMEPRRLEIVPVTSHNAAQRRFVSRNPGFVHVVSMHEGLKGRISLCSASTRG